MEVIFSITDDDGVYKARGEGMHKIVKCLIDIMSNRTPSVTGLAIFASVHLLRKYNPAAYDRMNSLVAKAWDDRDATDNVNLN